MYYRKERETKDVRDEGSNIGFERYKKQIPKLQSECKCASSSNYMTNYKYSSRRIKTNRHGSYLRQTKCVFSRSSMISSTICLILLHCFLHDNSQWHEWSSSKTRGRLCLVEAVTASPKKFRDLQPDGTQTPLLEIKGGEKGHFMKDTELGYTVIVEDETDYIVYAKRDVETGTLVSSGLVAGAENVTEDLLKIVTERGVEPSEEAKKKLCGRFCEDEDDDDDFKFMVGKLTIHFSGQRHKKTRTLGLRGVGRRYNYTSLEFAGAGYSIQEDVIEEDESLTEEGYSELEEYEYPDSMDLDEEEYESRSIPSQLVDNLTYLNQFHRQTQSMASGTLRNLVILMKFADHTERRLPSIKDVDALMNTRNGHPQLAPTGSVRDVYRKSSYDKFDLLSTVVGWVTLPENEAYYADSSSGSSSKYEEALVYALNVLDGVNRFSFNSYDKNEDGTVDSVMFLHSGYGAEWGATDCFGQKTKNRIWSHKFKLDPAWISSKSGHQVVSYHTSSALWDSCGSDIARIGTIAHELGHVLGLPDLYMGGSGIGSHGLMGNSWGFDGSQHYPPTVSPWSKLMMGWVRPTIVRKSGRYTLKPSIEHPQVIKITAGYPAHEYLLIENRQKIGFDAKLPKSGLIIYHIDELASFYKNPGYDGQEGWPENGNHFRVAILQQDGKYELEKGLNRGDEFDVFGPGDEIGPGSTTSRGPYPNTDSYQSGNIQPTGIRIYDIQQEGDNISFQIDIPGSTSDAPTKSPVVMVPENVATSELGTTFTGEIGSHGCMFDVIAGSFPIVVFSLDFHTRLSASQTPRIPIKVYTKSGTHRGYENGSPSWKLISSTTVAPGGFYKRTHIDEADFSAITIRSKSVQAFYIVMDTPDLRYSRGLRFGDVFASNSDLTILQGTGVKDFFGKSWSPRVFNGFVIYSTIKPDDTTASFAIKNSDEEPIKENYKLTTTFIDNNGSYGNMFNVRAHGGPVTVTSLDIHLRPMTIVPVEVYTKKNSYQGHERNALAWELICEVKLMGQGRGKATTIPAADFKPVNIDQGNVQAFYVTVKKRGDLRYSNRLVMQSDDFIEIMGGSGIGTYPFAFGSKTIFSPRGFNGSIHYSTDASKRANVARKENNEIMTSFAADNGSYASMWNIYAKKGITVTTFDFHTKALGEISVEVFSKTGSYIGCENKPESWTMICKTVVAGKGSFKRTNIPSGCFSPIQISSGETRGFYLTLQSLDLRYTSEKEMKIGDVYVENDDLSISVGSGIGNYPLSLTTPVYPQRVFNGVVAYKVNSESSTGSYELKSTLEGGNRSFGCLFSVKARKDLKISTIGVHTESDQEYVEVYTRQGSYEGFTNSMDGWSFVVGADISGKGKGVVTQIEEKVFSDVEIRKGEIQSFYVTLISAKLAYTNGKEVGSEFVTNDDLSLMEGLGVGDYLLTKDTKLYSPRIFNGALIYSVL